MIPPATALPAGAYLLGAVPFGYLVGRLRGVDVRRLGSGNIGATNILRAVGKGPAALTLLLDAAKGFFPTWLAAGVFRLDTGWVLATGIAAIIGHGFPVFLGFRGGKGVATGLGVLIGLSPPAAAAAVLAWGLVYTLTRIVSLASLCAALLLPGLLRLFAPGDHLPAFFGAAVAAFVVFTHRGNIKRLVRGEEPITSPWKK